MKELLSLYLRYYKNKFRGSFFKALDFTGGHNIQGVMKAVSAAGHNGIGLDAIWHNGLCKNMTLAQLKHDLQMLTSPECGNTLCFDMCIDLYMYSSPYLAAYAGMYFSAERNSRQEKNNQKKGTHPPVQDKQFEKISKRLNTLQPSP